MGNPVDIVNVAHLYGQTDITSSLGTTSTELMAAVPTDYVHKVNTIIVANIDGTNNCDVTMWIAYDTLEVLIAKTITVPADSSLSLIDTPLYINYLATGTGNRLMAVAQTVDDIDVVVSYEAITDVA